MPSAAPLYAQLGTLGMNARIAWIVLSAKSCSPKYLQSPTHKWCQLMQISVVSSIGSEPRPKAGQITLHDSSGEDGM